MRVLALEVEGVRAPGEQAGELGEQEGAGVGHDFQFACEGGDLGAEVVHVGDDAAEALKLANEDVTLACFVKLSCNRGRRTGRGEHRGRRVGRVRRTGG